MSSRSSRRFGSRASRKDDSALGQDRGEDKWSDVSDGERGEAGRWGAQAGRTANIDDEEQQERGGRSRKGKEVRTSAPPGDGREKRKKEKVKRTGRSRRTAADDGLAAAEEAAEANPVIGLEGGPLLLFNSAHSEAIGLSQYRQLTAQLQSAYRLTSNLDAIEGPRLSLCRVLVLPGTRRALSQAELQSVESFMQDGGSVLVLAAEGAGDEYGHLNALTAPHGISIERDAVVRSVYAKGLFHPKEALVRDASLSAHLDSFVIAQQQTRSGGGAAGKTEAAAALDDEDWEKELLGGSRRLSVVYPYGCSLSVAPPAVPLLTSGPLCFPAHRSLCALARVGSGQLAVLGSFHCWDDAYIGRQDNAALLTAVVDLLCGPSASSRPERVDAERPEYAEAVTMPDTASLSSRLRSCLAEPEELPLDWTQLFDSSLFKFDTALIPEAIALYAQLQVTHAPLSLIAPQFEVPLPPLLPAIFHPAPRELQPPPLELFDLDELFSADTARIAQLTNRSSAADLDAFCREVGSILGITDRIRREREAKSGTDAVTAQQVLAFVLKKLIACKRTEQDDAGSGGLRRGAAGRAGDGNGSNVLQLESVLAGGTAGGADDGLNGASSSTSVSVGSTSRSRGSKEQRDSVEMTDDS